MLARWARRMGGMKIASKAASETWREGGQGWGQGPRLKLGLARGKDVGLLVSLWTGPRGSHGYGRVETG